MSKREITQLRALPQDPAAVWQGGWLPLPLRLKGDEPDHPGYVSALWGVNDDGQQGPELDPRVVGTTRHADLLTALVRFAVSKRTAGYRPGRVEVCDAGEAEFLRGPLGEAGITVALVAGPPAHLPALAGFAEFMRNATPGLEDLALFNVPDMTRARIWSFADAAREFYLAAPWERLNGDEDPIHIVQPDVAPELRFVSVMGSSGEAFGLGFHDTWDDFLTRVRNEATGSRPSWMVTFDLPENPAPPDLAAWQEHGLPIAADDAFPLALRLDPRQGGTRPPTPAELTTLEGLLRVIARANAADLDGGRWTRTVPTHDGPVSFTLELPELLAPPSHEETTARNWQPDPRALERMQLIIRRRFEDQPPADVDEMNRILAHDYTGRRIDDLPFTPRNDWDRAQELCYAAFAAHGHRRVALARQALRVDPRCADAHVILAEHAETTEEACAHYAAAAVAGLAHLDPRNQEEHAGEHWQNVLARPHLRALHGWALTLRSLGRIDEAIAQCQELLLLDRDDHQNIRELLLVLLLQERRDQEAAALLRSVEKTTRFEDEFCPWLEVLTLFRLHGDSPEATAALARARRLNRYVADYLLDDRARKIFGSDRIAPGHRGDAQLTALDTHEFWAQTEGALAWLKSSPKASRVGPARQGGGSTRPSRNRTR
jgi:tetratricopeptide (TPR) repeat protein